MSVEVAAANSTSPVVDTPSSHANESVDGSVDSTQAPTSQPRRASVQFPAPKTDKPRPHVCQNCGRAFARFEHLKRHERSHTKEKPFECPECARCFARRDLLLRHQQKLHFAQNTTKPRGNRRESMSTASATSNRVRKGSVATSTGSGHAISGPRPRANTLAHLDISANASFNRNGPHGHRASLDMSQRPTGRNGFHAQGLQPLRLEPGVPRQGVDAPLHTAPAYTGGDPFDFDSLFPEVGGPTVNPAQLHFGAAAANQVPHFDPSMQTMIPDNPPEDDFSWMRDWSLGQMHQLAENDYAIDEPSPPDVDQDHSMMMPPPTDGLIDASAVDMNMHWIDVDVQQLMNPALNPLSGFNQGLHKVDTMMNGSPPQIVQDSPSDGFFSPPNPQMSSPGSFGPINAASTSTFGSDSPSMSSSMTGSARHSSVTSVSTSSITDNIRQALIFSLSQPSVFGHNHRKYSQPSISSPLSSAAGTRPGPNLPSTADLQRYVNAYIQYFHPHLPFLHIPTLSFDSPDYVSNIRSSSMHSGYGNTNMVGGGGCLILAMAALGALYEFEYGPSKELFDAAKRMIQLYLEERRKSDMSAAVSGHHASNGAGTNNTPLWLVQAMLLNVIYGHHCSDKQSADIASNHCAALVSLARAADLTRPASAMDKTNVISHPSDDGSSPTQDPNQAPQSATYLAWTKWKGTEERKRTLFAVFIVSSLLVTAYNHAPAMMNSELSLNLPCEETLWSADNASDWLARGGSQADDQNALPFSTALSNLLTANTRSSGSFVSGWQSNGTSAPATRPMNGHVDMRPSTFGCFVLINALHNFIWETRSRHHSRQWTEKETEAMAAHIEPALNAWQAAWKANEQHHIQRPNPFGLGPLAADSIPLLDLAFIRLYVDSGRSKEAFWQRDFEAMSNEFARSADIANPTEGSPELANSDAATRQGLRRPSQVLTTGQGSKREKYLRRAAFYAADSLFISTKFSLTYADASAHELPIQSALCFMDCGQVLAEWAATVQERVGRYLGVLGREDIDFGQVPAIMLLEAEDIDLLGKLDSICLMMEEKLVRHANAFITDFALPDPSTGMPLPQQGPQDHIPALRGIGYGSKVLKAIALMLEKPAAWPVLNIMSSALQVQADHMSARAEASLTAFS